MKRGLKVFHKGLVLVLVPLLVEVVFISALALLLWQSDREANREFRYRRCAATGAKLIALSNDLLFSAFCCYQGDAQFFLKVFDGNVEKMKQRMAQLEKSAKGDPLAESAADQLVTGLGELMPILQNFVKPARSGRVIVSMASTVMETKQILGDKKNSTFDHLSNVARIQEQMSSQSRKRSQRLQEVQFQILLFGFAANLAVGIALAVFYRNSIMVRLQNIMANTQLLSENKPIKALLTGDDEIAELDRAFHQMERELKDAATREESLFVNATDVICVLDQDLIFTKLNPACRKLWDYDPGQLVGKSVKTILRLEGSEKQLEALKESNTALDLELSITKADGTIADNLWSTFYSKSESKLYCIVHDISERKQIERMKQAFLDTMGNDLARPLERIMADLSKLLGPLKEQLTQGAISRLETTRYNMGRLLGLVSDLLEMSGLQSGHLETPKQICRVAELIDHGARDLDSMARQKGVTFEINCSAQQCYASPNRIIQIIVNLVSNAIKFSNPGSTITITARDLNDFVVLEVVDQGRGVPVAFQKTIFEKFGQVEAADGKRKKGSGLGLPICKEIVEEHGGEIGVESEEGQGSKFWIKLPRDEDTFNKLMLAKQLAEIKPATILLGAPEEKQLLAKSAPGNNISMFWKGLILVGVPVVIEIILVSALSFLLFQTEKSRLAELHERRLAAAAYNLLSNYSGLCAISAKAPKLDAWLLYDSLSSQIISAGKELNKVLSEDKETLEQYKPAAEIHEKIIKKFEAGRKIMECGLTNKDTIRSAMIDRYELWPQAFFLSRRLSKLVEDAEKREFINPKKQVQIRRTQGFLLFGGLVANVGLSLYLAVFFSKDITSRLRIVTDNTQRFSKGAELNYLLPGKDEISKLDQEFHRVANLLMEARQKERAVFDNSKDLIFVIDSKGHFLNTNPASQQAFMMGKAELQSRMLPEFLAEGWDAIESAIESGALKNGVSLEAKLKEGDVQYLLMSFSRPTEQSDIYCIAHDISDRKELEQMKQEFLAVVSHDLRSPLTAVLGSATMIEAGIDGDIGANALSVVLDIASQSEQLIELITDLLDYEKLAAGKMQFAAIKIDSHALLLQCEDHLQKRYDDLILTVSGVKCEIMGDPDRLAQAICSVLSLIACRSPNGAHIKVNTSINNNFLIISADDTAEKAISQAEAIELFERIKAPRTNTLQMSTLALPLAKLIIEAHGGQVNVSRSATGLTFSVELPTDFNNAGLSRCN